MPFGIALDTKAPVYVIEPLDGSDVDRMIISRLKKARYRYRSFNPLEESRLSATDAVRQTAASAGVLTSLQDPSEAPSAHIHNLHSLFVAGLADGMGKPSLILAPKGYQAPLDVRDDVKTYAFPDDIGSRINDFSLEVTEYLQEIDPAPFDTETLLQSLRIGDPTAENEMTTLGNYYLRTDEFTRAQKGDVNLVVGRKGSGKTALFIQLRDKLRSDKRNVVVDLKPEGYQLLKLKEEILKFLTEGSRQHLLTAFWDYLLLLEVAHKILEKDQRVYKHNHTIRELYRELKDAYEVPDFSSEGDFSERLLVLSQAISDQYKAKFPSATGVTLTAQQVTQVLYRHDIRALRERISTYLQREQEVWILFDNLDKGWSTGGLDSVDVVVLRCLIDAGRKVERDMAKSGHTAHCIVFIRNDVYEHLMQHSADYGKEMRAVLDWSDPELLREMLRLRLVAGLPQSSAFSTFQQIWPTLCVSHYLGDDTSSYFIERSLMRPRNVLKIFNHCRGFASNFGHPKIDDTDIEKGMRAYSNDLLVELDRELTDVFPRGNELLYQFLDTERELSKERLERILRNAGFDDTELSKVTEFLIYYGVVGIKLTDGDQYIYHVNYDPKKLRIRAERAGETVRYVINPAFWIALSVREGR
jgi:HEPN domain-containing protein